MRMACRITRSHFESADVSGSSFLVRCYLIALSLSKGRLYPVIFPLQNVISFGSHSPISGANSFIPSLSVSLALNPCCKGLRFSYHEYGLRLGQNKEDAWVLIT